MRAEQRVGRGHLQRLVRAAVVVSVHPGVDRCLRGREIGERACLVEEVAAQTLMPALDLAGRGRCAWFGQPRGDPVLPADPLEQHLRRIRLAESAGELFPVVGQHFRGHAIAGHGIGECLADRASARLGDDLSDHHEPGVIVNSCDQLAFSAIGQEHPAHDVELPQPHRRIALPPPVLAPMLLLLLVDQPVTHQHPIRGRSARRRPDTTLGQLERDPLRTPPRMLPPHLTDRGLHLHRHTARRVPRPR